MQSKVPICDQFLRIIIRAEHTRFTQMSTKTPAAM